MRRRFGKVINELAKKDDKIVLIVGDIGYGIFDDFRKKHPKKFFNLGICEQSMIGFASGMALEGLKPWVYTITPFLIERPFEQIKLDIDQQNVNVNLVGFADYPTLGPSHAELDGERLMKLFKNIKCINNNSKFCDKDIQNDINNNNINNDDINNNINNNNKKIQFSDYKKAHTETTLIDPANVRKRKTAKSLKQLQKQRTKISFKESKKRYN